MRIADPSKVEVTINLPVSDAIILNEGAPVELYLDSNPLKPVKATMISASFPTDSGQTLPRIGLRGTAKVYGDEVRLGYYLLRKPLLAVRQWTGC